MSNLSELLPAGAGAKSAEFVASGTLGSGVTVALQSDGTVSAVSGRDGGTGTAAIFETGITIDTSIACDPTNSKIVVGYRDDSNGGYGTAVVGTVSGTTITFGTPVLYAGSLQTDFTTTVFDANSEKFVIFYRSGANNYGYSVVGTVSGTSISFGTPVVFNSANTQYFSGTYDSANNKSIICFSDRGTTYPTAMVGTVSGTSISFGAKGVLASVDGRFDPSSVTFDSVSNKVIGAYRNSSNEYGYTAIGTVSGTSISFGTAVSFNTSSSTNSITSVFDSTNNKVVIAYWDADPVDIGYAIVGTVSGTSISFGTEVQIQVGTYSYVSGAFDASVSKVVIVYKNNQNNSYGTLISGTVSGTSITFETPVIYEAAQAQYNTAVYDSNNETVFIAYQDAGNSSRGTAIGYQHPFSTNTDFIGITDQAIADTATGAVIVQGGVSGKAKGPITTAVGTRSTFNSGSTSYPDMVYDEANQKIILSYRDDGTSGYPTAVVGTVSGTSISWGTPVIIRSNTSVTGIGPKIAYDSTTEQVVVAYLISDIGYAKVGTVSGTSISFGAEATFESGDTAYNSIAYDTANSRVVIAYKYNTAPATDDGYAVVGTVSGTSISFGSRVLFDSGTALYTSTVYDSNTGKIVISYDSSGPKAVVGTVSGASISFGSVATITMTTPNMTYSDLVYDAGSQKVVLTTRKNAAPNNGLALVGTVSGTSISFGTEVEFTTDAVNFMAATYDSTLGKVAICYEESATDDGKMVLGTVSGTSISFTDPVIFDSTSTVNYVTAAVYDSDQQTVVSGYSDSASSNFGRATAISITAPLTIGSDYYVQSDGSLSTTVSSVPAGRALSSTSILLEG